MLNGITEVVAINSDLCADQPVESKAVMATIVLGIMGTITQITISLRLYSRKKLATALGIGIDDYLIVMASVVILFTQITG
jgi:hypothetical protein